LGFPTAEVPFQPALRQAGVSKYTVRRMASFAADAVLSFSRLPLRLALGLGLAAALFGLGYGGYAAVRSLLGPAGFDASGAVLLASVYLVGGCILCGLGLVGEYVGRIYEQVKGRPLYVLKESSPGALGATSHAGIGRAA
jgi:hypothetical protein